jgi:predicted RNA methylase
MTRDSFYTPKVLADKLIGFIKNDNFKSVADFCAGDGELLRAAVDRWPEIKCFGSDISAEAIDQMKSKHKNWKLSNIDFLDKNDREKAKIFKKQPLYDLILLNPPFSCIGGTISKVEFDDEIFNVSTAMSFLVTSLKYLKPKGCLYAILPTSIANSQKDKTLWRVLEDKHNLSILEEPKTKYFKGCTPNVILVSLNDFTQISRQRNIPRIPHDFNDISIFRGKLSMNLVEEVLHGDYLIHTTNMSSNRIVNLHTRANKTSSRVTGPAVLLPRVGNPTFSKLCIIKPHESYVLSDCVIAIKTSSLEDSYRLFNYIQNHWEQVKEMYTGTGARYITIEKLIHFLNLDRIKINFQNRQAI